MEGFISAGRCSTMKCLSKARDIYEMYALPFQLASDPTHPGPGTPGHPGGKGWVGRINLNTQYIATHPLCKINLNMILGG